MRAFLEHAAWANARCHVSLAATPVEDGVRLLAHVLTTERIYHERMIGADPWPQDFWPDLTLDQCGVMVESNRELYGGFDASRAGAERRIARYRNSRGEYFATSIADMLRHLALHGEHHRGQIASLVRAAGGTPAMTDFIVFTRERAAGAS